MLWTLLKTLLETKCKSWFVKCICTYIHLSWSHLADYVFDSIVYSYCYIHFNRLRVQMLQLSLRIANVRMKTMFFTCRVVLCRTNIAIALVEKCLECRLSVIWIPVLCLLFVQHETSQTRTHLHSLLVSSVHIKWWYTLVDTMLRFTVRFEKRERERERERLLRKGLSTLVSRKHLRTITIILSCSLSQSILLFTT